MKSPEQQSTRHPQVPVLQTVGHLPTQSKNLIGTSRLLTSRYHTGAVPSQPGEAKGELVLSPRRRRAVLLQGARLAYSRQQGGPGAEILCPERRGAETLQSGDRRVQAPRTGEREAVILQDAQEAEIHPRTDVEN